MTYWSYDAVPMTSIMQGSLMTFQSYWGIHMAVLASFLRRFSLLLGVLLCSFRVFHAVDRSVTFWSYAHVRVVPCAVGLMKFRSRLHFEHGFQWCFMLEQLV